MANKESEGGVWITTEAVYHQVTGMRDDLQKGISELKTAVEHIKDHESRIRTLEKFMWAAPVSVVLAVGGFLSEHFHLIGG